MLRMNRSMLLRTLRARGGPTYAAGLDTAAFLLRSGWRRNVSDPQAHRDPPPLEPGQRYAPVPRLACVGFVVRRLLLSSVSAPAWEVE